MCRRWRYGVLEAHYRRVDYGVLELRKRAAALEAGRKRVHAEVFASRDLEACCGCRDV